MSFIWPKMLGLLLAVPLLIVAYLALMRRRARQQSELGAMGLAQTDAGRWLRVRRHIPPLVFLLAIVILIVGVARPEAAIHLPRREGKVILAFDVSSSMKAADLKPTRLDAAKAAAKTFIAHQPSSIKIGVVAFSTSGFIVQAPTDVKADVRAAIRHLRPDGGTSLAQGIFTSLNALSSAPIALDPADVAEGAPLPDIKFIGSSAVVLLSDGENTDQLDPITFAALASQAGVRIYSIGIGSAEGAVVDIGGFSIATQLDEASLKAVAKVSNGAYFRAQDSAQLKKIYGSIDLQLTIHGDKTEITSLVAGVALLVLLLAGALSMRWFGRAP